MRIGVLFNNTTKKLPLDVAVRMARVEFSKRDDLADFSPTELRLHPAQTPRVDWIEGLAVVADERVPLNHLRVCTVTLSMAEELAYERRWFAGEVSKATLIPADLRENAPNYGPSRGLAQAA
jgi:hypothetical protein